MKRFYSKSIIADESDKLPDYLSALTSFSFWLLDTMKDAIEDFINNRALLLGEEISKIEKEIEKLETEIKSLIYKKVELTKEIEEEREKANEVIIRYRDFTKNNTHFVRDVLQKKKKIEKKIDKFYDKEFEESEELNKLFEQKNELYKLLEEEKILYKEKVLAIDRYTHIKRINLNGIKAINKKIMGIEDPSQKDVGTLVLDLRNLRRVKKINNFILREDIEEFRDKILPDTMNKENADQVSKKIWHWFKSFTGGIKGSELTSFDVNNILEAFTKNVETNIDSILRRTNFYKYIFHSDELKRMEEIDGKKYLRVNFVRYKEHGIAFVINNILIGSSNNTKGPITGYLLNAINYYIKEQRNKTDYFDKDIDGDKDFSLKNLITDKDIAVGKGKKENSYEKEEEILFLSSRVADDLFKRSEQIAENIIALLNKNEIDYEKQYPLLQLQIDVAVSKLKGLLPGIIEGVFLNKNKFSNGIKKAINYLLGFRGFDKPSIEFYIREITSSFIKKEIYEGLLKQTGANSDLKLEDYKDEDEDSVQPGDTND